MAGPSLVIRAYVLDILWILFFAIPLLYRRKDLFSGICFLVCALFSFYYAMRISEYSIFTLFELIGVAILIVMALSCFGAVKVSGPALPIILGVLAAVIAIPRTVGLLISTEWRAISFLTGGAPVDTAVRYLFTSFFPLLMPIIVPIPGAVAAASEQKPKAAPYANAPYGAAPAYGAAPQSAQPHYPRDAKSFGYIDMTLHVLLSLFTCGIWLYIWIYKTSKTLSDVPGEPRQDPAVSLLLCIFVPFYMIYWFYKQGKRAEIYAHSAGVYTSCASTCLIFAFLLPLVSYIVLQSTVNKAAQAHSVRSMV